MYLNKKVSVVLLFVVALTTFINADLLNKCINNKFDINNNGKISSFEKKMCERALKGKKLDEDNKKLDEDNKKLDEDIKN